MGFEPTTSSMPSRRAPNCATAPPSFHASLILPQPFPSDPYPIFSLSRLLSSILSIENFLQFAQFPLRSFAQLLSFPSRTQSDNSPSFSKLCITIDRACSKLATRDCHHFFFLRLSLSSGGQTPRPFSILHLPRSPVNLSKEFFPMSAEPISQHFRGVLCRHCGKPVRIPRIVSQKENEFHGHSDSGHTDANDAPEAHFHLVSRVFVLRCRSCERESIYAINQIVDCALTQVSAPEAHKEAAV
jgi:hypothetical protein